MQKILIVDNDESILEALELSLSEEGYQAFILQKTNSILKEISRKKPDLVILDMLLTGSDGREVCELLKSSQVSRDIPIIMFSAHPDGEGGSMVAGADDYLDKPFEMEDLLIKIKKLLKSSRIANVK